MAFATSGAHDVRAWAVQEGIEVPKTGSFSTDLIEKFNAQHKGKRYSPDHVDRYEWSAKPQKGRKRTLRINDAEVRAAAREAGVQVGKRGALRPEVKDAFVLGTLDALAQAQREAQAPQEGDSEE